MRYTQDIVPGYDFAKVDRLPLETLLDRTFECLRAAVTENQPYFPEPMLPEPAGTEAEIDELESSVGVRLPADYRAFLRRAKYAVLDDGVQVWGLDHNGISYGEGLWLSDKHHNEQRFLVFGCYWAYADGDQLLIPVGAPDQAVVLYLHEHGPKFEVFAPSFSLALWRLAHDHGAV